RPGSAELGGQDRPPSPLDRRWPGPLQSPPACRRPQARSAMRGIRSRPRNHRPDPPRRPPSRRRPAAGFLEGELMGSPLDPTGELRELASDCVHCGFCLPACPTYQLWGEEMDSPRGRIHLITQLLDGSAGTAATGLHLDRCLGCMACVPACPSGVRYDRLITAARSWQEDPPPVVPPDDPAATASATPSAPATSLTTVAGPDTPTPPAPGSALSAPSATPDTARTRVGRAAAQLAQRRRDRRAVPGQLAGSPPVLPARNARDRATRAAIFATFPYPRRLRPLLAPLRAAQKTGLAGRLTPELAAALRVAPPPAGGGAGRGPLPGQPQRLPRRVPARGTRRAVVGMLTGCVQQVFFP